MTATMEPSELSKPKRVFVLGGSGTIGLATIAALAWQGHDVVAFVRTIPPQATAHSKIEFRIGDVTNAESLCENGFRHETFDVLLSCLASRNGQSDDAWRIDYQAHMTALTIARQTGIAQMILLSAICVQRPRLAFQKAKLAFETALIDSGIGYSIVRPTAFFKSLSGQVERVQRGKAFLLFGNGALTACKPISDRDVADFLVGCIADPAKHNAILPIGGPGDAITPRQQGDMLFALLGNDPRFRHVPVRMLDGIIALLDIAARFSSRAAAKAELARIGHYYATESMLVWNADAQRYDANATPSTGADTLEEHYRQLIAGETILPRSEHSVF